MAIFRHTDDLPSEARGVVVAIGNFDGVHLGHRALLAEAAQKAKALGAPLGVLTFEPHPRSVFRPQDPPFRLTPLRARTHALEALGVEHLYVLHFDLGFAAESAESFVHSILVEGLAVRHVIVGQDFRFGHKRSGDAALLERLGRDNGFGVSALAPVVADDGVIYSSSTIRRFLSDGQPAEAARQLGRPWQIEGRVEPGDQRGRTIGFPTANLGIDGYLVPALGVYAVQVLIDEADDGACHARVPGAVLGLVDQYLNRIDAERRHQIAVDAQVRRRKADGPAALVARLDPALDLPGPAQLPRRLGRPPLA